MEHYSKNVFERRIRDCWEAGRYYLGLSAQCAEMSLSGMAWWFRGLADEEMSRALKFHDVRLAGISEIRLDLSEEAETVPDSPEPAGRLLRSWAESRARVLGC